jgi:hypothetical protein
MRELVFLFSLLLFSCEYQVDKPVELTVTTSRGDSSTATLIYTVDEEILFLSIWGEEDLANQIMNVSDINSPTKTIVTQNGQYSSDQLNSLFVTDLIQTSNLEPNSLISQTENFKITLINSDSISSIIKVDFEENSLLLVSSQDSLFLNETAKISEYQLDTETIVYTGERTHYSSLFLGYSSPIVSVLPPFMQTEKQELTVEFLLQQECKVFWLAKDETIQIIKDGEVIK